MAVATSPRWIRAFPLDEIEPGSARVLRHEGRQIAVFRTPENQLFATDNHCPHEGYPLAQGYLKGCVLTCAWHNFKFDLGDGSCLKGDEDVRTWPVRVVEGAVEVDLAQDARATDLAPTWKSLEQGLAEWQIGRVARDVARLLQGGAEPAALALAAACHDARVAEYGTTHALPVAVDALALAERRSGLARVHPLVVAMDVAAEPNVRRPPRPRPEPVEPPGDPAVARARFAATVEAEEGPAAEALLRGALRRGTPLSELETWLWEPCAEHFLGFGHPPIYLVKTMELLARDTSQADLLLGALTWRIVSSTREDTLPPWSAFRGRLEALEPELPRLWAASRECAPSGWRPEGLLSAVLDGSGAESFAALVDELEAGVPADLVAGALLAAAAERILRFDVAIDADPTVQDGWLFVTHGMTYASAARAALARWPRPRALRLLFFALRFVNGTRPLDGGGAPPSDEPARSKPGDLRAAVQAGDAQRAVATARAAVRGGFVPALAEEALDLCLPDALARPIVVAHALKTGVVAAREARALSAQPALAHLAALPLAAFARLLASPIRERSLTRVCREATELVGHGRIPKLLSS